MPYDRFKPIRLRIKGSVACAVLLWLCVYLACEVPPTGLEIEGGSSPIFRLSGNGGVLELRVVGPDQQRVAEGEYANVYWLIMPSDLTRPEPAGRLRAVTYGRVPTDYMQLYPETGTAPLLQEGEYYRVQVLTMNAPGNQTWFMIKGGKAAVPEYRY